MVIGADGVAALAAVLLAGLSGGVGAGGVCVVLDQPVPTDRVGAIAVAGEASRRGAVSVLPSDLEAVGADVEALEFPRRLEKKLPIPDEEESVVVSDVAAAVSDRDVSRGLDVAAGAPEDAVSTGAGSVRPASR